MKRRAALVALAALAACKRETAGRDRSSLASGDDDGIPPARSPYREAPEGLILASSALESIRVAKDRPPFLLAEVGGRPSLLLIATLAAPDRWQPMVAMSRLARRVGLAVVPVCVVRREPLAVLLDAADLEARVALREAATLPDGRVPLAALSLPARTTMRGTSYSNEAAHWARLASSPEQPTGAAAETEQSYVAMLTLDYLAANFLRRAVEEDDAGRLWLVDNRSAFVAHPAPRAIDIVFDRLKRVRRFPRELAATLARLDEQVVTNDFCAGDYEAWLAHARPIRELLLRARALRGLVEAAG